MHMNQHPLCAYGSCDTRKQTPGAFYFNSYGKVLVLVTYELLDIHITCLLPFEFLPHEYHINAAAWAAAFYL